MRKLLATSAAVLGLALALPAFAQTSAPPPAAPAATTAPATTKPAAKPKTTATAHAPASHHAMQHATTRPASKAVVSQDAQVDQLNQMSLQAAQKGQPMMVPGTPQKQ